tara:strand:+ start:838 stop:1332 length:495 start_codon:yes stop_codon:yes gene_type:complete
MGTKRVGWARIRSLINENQNQLKMSRKKVDNSTFNTGAAVTATLTAAQGGTHFNIDGTGDIVVNLPALSPDNVGLSYSFMVTTAVGSGKSVTFVLPGDSVSNFYAERLDYATGSYPRLATSGDTLTLGALSVAGSRVELLCIADDGTNSTWQAYIASDVEPTLG